MRTKTNFQRSYDRNTAIEKIMDALKWGETVPAVFGGNGGCGFDELKPTMNLDHIEAMLRGAQYEVTSNVEEDFAANGAYPCFYRCCCQFNNPGGWWLQVLLF